MDIPIFNGGWSYTQKEMIELFKYIVYTNDFNILEFGSGDSTVKLYHHFKKVLSTSGAISLLPYSTNSKISFR